MRKLSWVPILVTLFALPAFSQEADKQIITDENGRKRVVSAGSQQQNAPEQTAKAAQQTFDGAAGQRQADSVQPQESSRIFNSFPYVEGHASRPMTPEAPKDEGSAKKPSTGDKIMDMIASPFKMIFGTKLWIPMAMGAMIGAVAGGVGGGGLGGALAGAAIGGAIGLGLGIFFVLLVMLIK